MEEIKVFKWKEVGVARKNKRGGRVTGDPMRKSWSHAGCSEDDWKSPAVFKLRAKC